MRQIRTVAIALSFAFVAFALSSCKLSNETQAKLAIASFSASCPSQMKPIFAKDATIASLGDETLTSLTANTCTCMASRLEKLPAEKIVALDRKEDAAAEKEVEAVMSPCAAIAVKPHLGALCMAGVKQAGGDESVAGPRCDCVQRKVNEMDDASIESTFSNIEQGFSSVAESCMSAE